MAGIAVAQTRCVTPTFDSLLPGSFWQWPARTALQISRGEQRVALGCELDAFDVASEQSLRFAHRDLGRRERSIELRRVGDGFGSAVHRLVVPPDLRQRVAEIAPGDGVVGAYGHRLPVMLDGLCAVAQRV